MGSSRASGKKVSSNTFGLFGKRYAGDRNWIEAIRKKEIEKRISKLEDRQERNITRSEKLAERAKDTTDTNLAADYTKRSEMRKSRADRIGTRIENLKKRISATSTTPGSTPAAPAAPAAPAPPPTTTT